MSVTIPSPDLTLPSVVSALHRLSRAASAVAIGTGSLVLVGWWADIDVLKRIAPGLVAMNPATAVAFICLGGSLAILARGNPGARAGRAAVALAVIPVIAGAVRLLGIVSPLDAGLDQILFGSQLQTADAGLPNRMAPNTAINFILTGTALAILDRSFRNIRWPAQILALIAAMSALLALSGYAYGVRFFYGIGSYIPMALHTAAAFLMVAAGILASRPSRGIMHVISSDSSGGALVRRLLPAVIVIPASLGWLRLVGQDAWLLDSKFAHWIVVVAMMTILAVLVGWNGKLLLRSDLERVVAERTLAYHGTHDALTQLPNRLLFSERIAAALDRAKESGRSTALLFIDLDRFKVINDSLGHGTGDELLINAGRRLERLLEEDEIVARIGGDEFTVLLPSTDESRVIELAEDIQEAFARSFRLGPHEIYTTASIGIAFSGEGDEPHDLVRHADIAMYRAKAAGRARHVMFTPDMDEAAQRRMELEIDLRHAIDAGELRVFYQPEVEIESGHLVGMEALVRWAHPIRGLVSPSEFLAVAEETGLVLPIGRWVLREACRQAKAWEDEFDIDLAVSVNLSGTHFQQATLIKEVSDVIDATGISAGHLILEITESVVMEGAETTIEILRRLKATGVRLAIDDFGTGFSSLAYLKRFPVDYLKIDKSFVDGVALQGHDTAIVQAVIALGHALGLQIIAEGVETSEQVDRLQALGSELGQGYYFSEPLSAAQMPELLSQAPPWMEQPEAPN